MSFTFTFWSCFILSFSLSCFCHLVQTSLNPISSPGTGTQSSVGSSSIYGITQLSASAPAYTGTYQSLPSSVGPSSSSQKEHPFPERPGQQECQYYMKTGDCKFGSSCRFHHPRELIVPKMDVTLSPFGLPLRPVSFFWHLLLHYYALHEWRDLFLFFFLVS